MSVERRGVLAGGNFITDYVKIIDNWPEQDTLASISKESMCNGGGPYNILKDLRILAPDLPVEACGLVGNDPNGQWILDDCHRNQIGTSQLQQSTLAATSYTDAMTVATTGRRTFFHQRGTNALLNPGHFDFSKSNAKVFALGYLLLLDAMDELRADSTTGSAEVLKAARDAGLVAAVDCVSTPSPNFREVVMAALKQTDIMFINEFEIGQVLGRSVGATRDAMSRAVKELDGHNKTDATIVLHAVPGAVAISEGEVYVQPSVKFPMDQIAGSSGAGDAFAAGYLLGVHEEEPIQRCLLQGVGAAAQSLTHPTPSDGLSTMTACLNSAVELGFQDF